MWSLLTAYCTMPAADRVSARAKEEQAAQVATGVHKNPSALDPGTASH